MDDEILFIKYRNKGKNRFPASFQLFFYFQIILYRQQLLKKKKFRPIY